MAYGQLSSPEKTLVYGMLVAGAIVFSFPFVWMVGTSFKVRREMAAADLRVTPTTPVTRDESPYIDETEFEAPECPDGLPVEVWEQTRAEMESVVRQRIADWSPKLPNSDTSIELGEAQQEAYVAEMLEGIFEALSARISDDVRYAAIADSADATNLGEAAIAKGASALLGEVGRLVDGELLEETFDSCYRRFCLGECRVRTKDYKLHSVYTGSEWRVENGPAELAAFTERDAVHQRGELSFAAGSGTAVFSFEGDLPVATGEIDRVYITYRGDASWARLVFEAVRDGRVYRTREVQNLYERDWMEAELRWPTDRPARLGRRTHLVLRDCGVAPADATGLTLRVVVTRNSRFGAWRDKVLRNYRTVFREVPFARYIMTSLALSILCIVLNIFSCTLVAYAFSRLEWPGRDVFFGIMLATMMIPAQVTMIPGFLIVRHLGWYGTLLPLWVFNAFGGAFFIFLLRQFFKSVPTDLEDAARIDGCGFLGVYWHVMLPLVKPTIATIAIYTFMGTWNNFMGPLIYVNDERLFPLALGLFRFSLRTGSDVGLVMAGSFLMTLPILVMFFFLQRYFIQGISLTGMKG